MLISPGSTELNLVQFLLLYCRTAAGRCCNNALLGPSQTCLVKVGYWSKACVCVSSVRWIPFSEHWCSPPPARLEALPVPKLTDRLTKALMTLSWVYPGEKKCMQRTSNRQCCLSCLILHLHINLCLSLMYYSPWGFCCVSSVGLDCHGILFRLS